MHDLKQLRVLQAVGEAGSFSLAAERLDYTQPAVSKIVAALERDAGTTLIDRGIRPLRLTDAGEWLVRRAAAAYEQLAAAEAEVDAIRRLAGGTLRIATFPGAAFVVHALQAFRRDHPDVAVTLVERGDPAVATRELRSGDLDLAILFRYPEAGEVGEDGLELTPLLAAPMDVVLPVAHPLAARPRIGFADLAGEAWLLPEGPGHGLIRRGCTGAG